MSSTSGNSSTQVNADNARMMDEKSFIITLHMVCSLDGMIAKKDNSMSWFETEDHFENGELPEDAASFLQCIDCYVMGSRTYEHACSLAANYGWAYGDKPTIVLTSRNLEPYHQNIEFYAGDLESLVKDRLQSSHHNVWVVGGSMLVKNFLQKKLANEIRVSILPILLGDGLPYFDLTGVEQALHLKSVKAYKNGMTELCYEVIENS